jgi:hypothetical protein
MEQTLNHNSSAKKTDEDTSDRGFTPAARSVEVYHLRSLVPEKDRVMRMVEYHEEWMLYWSGSIYHGPSFRKSLASAYGESTELDLQLLDWRWTALFFSILSAAIIGSPEAISASWGYMDAEKIRLAKQWGNAAMSCLQLGDFASKYHIHSIQAILNMHTSEHLVGSAKQFAVYQCAAQAIAKGLGLHR